MNAFEERRIENSVSAQKRAEVKLESPRATAKQSVRRPADASVGMPDGFVAALLLTLLLMAATLFLLFARLTDRPTALPEISAALSARLGVQPEQGEGIVVPGDVAPADIVSPDVGSSGDINADDDIVVATSESIDTSLINIPGEGPNSAVLDGGGNIGDPAMALLHQSDFSRATFPLALDDQQADQKWLMGFVPGENVYRIRVFPGFVAWSTLGYELSPPFRIETSVTVIMNEECSSGAGPGEESSNAENPGVENPDVENPDVESINTDSPEEPSQDGANQADECLDAVIPLGYAGLLARYQDPNNFYLFSVDGEGQSQLLSQINGEWMALLPWTPTANVNPAGKANILAVRDNGQFLTFYINGNPVHEVEPMIEPGLVGLAGGTRVEKFAESNFEWIRIYGNP